MLHVFAISGSMWFGVVSFEFWIIISDHHRTIIFLRSCHPSFSQKRNAFLPQQDGLVTALTAAAAAAGMSQGGPAPTITATFLRQTQTIYMYSEINARVAIVSYSAIQQRTREHILKIHHLSDGVLFGFQARDSVPCT